MSSESLSTISYTKLALDPTVTNVMGFLNDEDNNSYACTNKRTYEDVKNVLEMTREKRIVGKRNFVEALIKYINQSNVQREMYIFNVEKIENYLENGRINDNAPTNCLMQFVVDKQMIQTTTNASLHKESVIRAVIKFQPKSSYTLIKSFLEIEDNNYLNVDGYLLYNFDNRPFTEINGNIESDIVLINANTVTKNDKLAKESNIVVLGPLVISIGESAFEYCRLRSIVIPDSVTSIGNYAFRICTSLITVLIGDFVTNIGACAFSFCTSLTSIVLPDSLTRIERFVFEECENITTIVIPESVTTIEQGAFVRCSGLKSIIIPNAIISMGMYSFSCCTSLTSVIIGDSVITISYGSFSSCTSLSSVVIGDSVTNVENWAFGGCTSLTSVIIPDSVTHIQTHAFDSCTSTK